ncbi:MAG: quinol monooxygenase YgiN [Flavobacteriaceae bacterium]|jgi:quinol monooxygenase YgiN
MIELKLELPVHMQEPTRLGDEISITGKWVPTKKGNLFRKSSESKEMIKEWEAIHEGARNHKGMLSTEINHAIGQEAVLVHHVFQDADSLVDYFNTTATDHAVALTAFGKPDIHLIRGVKLNENVKNALSSKNVNGNFGEYLFGYVKNEYKRPDPVNAIQVTAKWMCKEEGKIDDLIYWWQRVGTDAYDLEKGLVRFEVFRVIGENALIIHETFETSDELQFHLSKGTAEKYKKDIDKIAFPENYFFRGPVSWMIRTYSKFLHLPATYSSQGSHFTQASGNMSDGLL